MESRRSSQSCILSIPSREFSSVRLSTTLPSISRVPGAFGGTYGASGPVISLYKPTQPVFASANRYERGRSGNTAARTMTSCTEWDRLAESRKSVDKQVGDGRIMESYKERSGNSVKARVAALNETILRNGDRAKLPIAGIASKRDSEVSSISSMTNFVPSSISKIALGGYTRYPSGLITNDILTKPLESVVPPKVDENMIMVPKISDMVGKPVFESSASSSRRNSFQRAASGSLTSGSHITCTESKIKTNADLLSAFAVNESSSNGEKESPDFELDKLSLSSKQLNFNFVYKMNRSRVGLSNLGNTCFMNSCIQCFLSTPPLMNYFLTKSYRTEINSNSTTKGKLAVCVADLVENVCNGSDHDVFSPADVKKLVSLVAPRFIGYQQQDSQEFLRFLVDALHEDLNRIRKPPKYVQIEDKDSDTMLIRSNRWWNNYISRNDSFIVELFAGQLQSTLVCSVCSHKSIVFDPFWDLSLPIPRHSNSDSYFSRLFNSEASECTLEDCLNFFTRPEQLSEENKAFCSKCKTHQLQTKKMEVFRFPEILVLHLKRFAFSRTSREKISTNVKFPLTSLDVSAYAAPESTEVNKKSLKYDLFAVSNHMGSLGGGHYVAHVRSDSDWYLCNDSRVQTVSSTSIGGNSSYVLFYHRKQN